MTAKRALTVVPDAPRTRSRTARPRAARAGDIPPRLDAESIEAYTVGTDDQRDRSKLPSPLLMVVIPKLPFVNSRTPVDCTPKT